MNGWLHMLWRMLSASLLFFVRCYHLMTSEGSSHRGEHWDRCMYALLCEILSFVVCIPCWLGVNSNIFVYSLFI